MVFFSFPNLDILLLTRKVILYHSLNDHCVSHSELSVFAGVVNIRSREVVLHVQYLCYLKICWRITCCNMLPTSLQIVSVLVFDAATI